MGRPQVSVIKRQREQARREKQQLKAEKKAQRKTGEKSDTDGIDFDALVVEGSTPEDADVEVP
jgi:hypothetical protein